MKTRTFADAHAPFVLTFRSGRLIWLDEITQHRTYRGLGVGHPALRSVDPYIQYAVDAAKAWRPAINAHHVIEPNLIPEKIELSKERKQSIPNVAILPRNRLPVITCFGMFESPEMIGKPASEGEEHWGYSALKIVWFQETFAFPIDPTVLSKILALEWDRCAEDTAD